MLTPGELQREMERQRQKDAEGCIIFVMLFVAAPLLAIAMLIASVAH